MSLKAHLVSLFRRKHKSSSKQPKTSLNHLPDECLLLIFDRLPLEALLRLGLVCHRWHQLQPVSYKRRRSLTILVGQRNWYKSISSNDPELDEMVNDDGMRAAGWWSNHSLVQRAKLPMKMAEVNLRMAETFVELFPNVTTLRVAMCAVAIESLEHTVYMLQQWRSKLVTLKVMGFFKFTVIPPTRRELSQLQSLLATINDLPQLKRLTLDFHHLIGSPLTGAIELPIVAQLEQFSLQSADSVDTVLDAIKPFVAKNPKLQTIHLKNVVTNLDISFTTIYHLQPNLAHRIVELRMYSLIELTRLKKLSDLFVNLKILQISVRNQNMYNVAIALAPLKQLECLHLYIDFPLPPSAPYYLLPEVPVLSSVKGLSLNFKLLSHVEMDYLFLEHIFPNLQMIGLRNKSVRCRACGIDNGRFLGALWHKRMLCARKICMPLRKCTALRRLYTDQQLYWCFDSRITVVNRNVFHP